MGRNEYNGAVADDTPSQSCNAFSDDAEITATPTTGVRLTQWRRYDMLSAAGSPIEATVRCGDAASIACPMGR